MFVNRLKPLSLLITLGLVTGACAPVRSPNGDTIAPTPNGTVQPHEAKLYRDSYTRILAMNATAQVSPEQLTKDGFPEKIITAQTNLTSSFNLDITVGSERKPFDATQAADATVVNLDGTQFSDYILVISVGHAFDTTHSEPSMFPEILKQFGMKPVTIGASELTKITLDDNTTLERGEFGLATHFDPNDSRDYAFILIPKGKLGGNLDNFMAKAVSVSEISFLPIEATETILGICTPTDTNLVPVSTTDAKSFGRIASGDRDTGGILVGPWLVGQHCSGAGVYKKDGSGRVSLIGMVVGTLPGNTQYNDDAVIYPFATDGNRGFYNSLDAAQSDFLARSAKP